MTPLERLGKPPGIIFRAAVLELLMGNAFIRELDWTEGSGWVERGLRRIKYDARLRFEHLIRLKVPASQWVEVLMSEEESTS